MRKRGDAIDDVYPGRASQLVIIFHVLTVHRSIHSFSYYLHQESANLFYKRQTVSASGFAGHTVSVITTQLCYCSTKAA